MRRERKAGWNRYRRTGEVVDGAVVSHRVRFAPLLLNQQVQLMDAVRPMSRLLAASLAAICATALALVLMRAFRARASYCTEAVCEDMGQIGWEDADTLPHRHAKLEGGGSDACYAGEAKPAFRRCGGLISASPRQPGRPMHRPLGSNGTACCRT